MMGFSSFLAQLEQSLAGGLQRRRFVWRNGNRIRCLTGSRKKLEPGTGATPTSRASHSLNAVSSSQPNSEMSTIT